MTPSNETTEARLAACRERIDDVDRRLVELLNERTTIVEVIGELKKGAQLPVYEPKREELVYANIATANQGPLPDTAMKSIFERIIDEMRRVQKDRMVQK